jgi:predicted PurR-regulated permease PerM
LTHARRGTTFGVIGQRLRTDQTEAGHEYDRGPGEDPPTSGNEPTSDEDIVAAAHAEAEDLRAPDPVLGTPGPPVNRRSPFMIGLLAAAGVAVTYGMVKLLVVAANILALIGLSLFLAVGLEPAVAWLTRRRIPRAVAVAAIASTIVAVVVGFLVTAIPVLGAQVQSFLRNLPQYVAQMSDHSTTLGLLDEHFHLQQRLGGWVGEGQTDLTEGLVTAGRAVLTGTTSALTVLVLTVYLLIDLPSIRRAIYRLTPASRRPRVILIGDEVAIKVGWYVMGNLVTSLIAGVTTLVWLLAFGVPYPVVLALTVAILDLVPLVGSTVAGVIVSLVALTVSLPVAVATAIFFVAYQFVENYVIVPRVIGRAVDVPATATMLAVLVGGAALGLLGALIAIPTAAAIDILLRETVYPRLDEA